MREIDSGLVEPVALTQWRAEWQGHIDFGYGKMGKEVRDQIKALLLVGQRGLCAYTGIGVTVDRSHIEHLLPQTQGTKGIEDVTYSNMVACHPAPNSGHVPYGAKEKDDWPAPAEWHLFVSPRSAGCEGRFLFNIQGRISTRPGDVAAATTVRRLGLDHRQLETLRRAAIEATLRGRSGRPASLDLHAARTRLAGLEAADRAMGQLLEPFCFALKQALRKHISRLEGIRNSKRQGD